MANSLGSLIVTLGLNAAEFTSGLTKSEAQARKFAQSVDRGIATAVNAATVGLLAMGGAAIAAAAAIESLIQGAAKFQDLAESTGAAAEDIASLQVSASVAGVAIEDVAGAANKLTKSLVGVDDESKAAGAALQAIGLNVAEFKQLNPVAQYEAVGKALAGFADGAGKVAVAQALFGKNGAEQLRVFKALEEAGGRQVILTEAQIRQADDFADKQTKQSATLKLYAQAVATQMIPSLTDLTKVATEVLREFVGLDGATTALGANTGAVTFAEKAADAFAFLVDAGDGVARSFQIIGTSIAAALYQAAASARLDFAEVARSARAYVQDIRDILDRPTMQGRLDAARAARKATEGATPIFSDARFVASQKPRLNFSGAQSAAVLKAPPVDEALKYVEALEKQLQGTMDLTTAEKALADIQSGRLGKLGVVQQQVILSLAGEVDAAKELNRVVAERAAFRKADSEAAEEAARANEAADRSRLRSLLENTPTGVFEKQQRDIEFLRNALYDGKIAADQYAEAVSGVIGKVGDAGKETKGLAEDLGMTFSSAFEDAIVGGESLSKVLQALDKDITRILIRRLVTEPLAEGISGLAKGGGAGIGDLFSSAAGYLGGLFGGGKAIGGPTMPNRLYQVGERQPEVYDDGSRQWLLTGSGRGNITPAANADAMRGAILHQTFLVPPMTERRQAQRIGADTARAVSASSARWN